MPPQFFIVIDGTLTLRHNQQLIDARNLRIRLNRKYGDKCSDVPNDFTFTVRLTDDEIRSVMTPEELAA